MLTPDVLIEFRTGFQDPHKGLRPGYVLAVEPHRVQIQDAVTDKKLWIVLSGPGRKGRVEEVPGARIPEMLDQIRAARRALPGRTPRGPAPGLALRRAITFIEAARQALPPIAPVVVRTDGAPRAVPKAPPPYRSAAYRSYVREHACCNPVCPEPGTPVEAHHAGPHGLGEQAPDTTCVPLSPACHRGGDGVTDTYALPGLSRAETERLIDQVQVRLLTEWLRRQEARAAAEAAHVVVVPLLRLVAAVLLLLLPVLAFAQPIAPPPPVSPIPEPIDTPAPWQIERPATSPSATCPQVTGFPCEWIPASDRPQPSPPPQKKTASGPAAGETEAILAGALARHRLEEIRADAQARVRWARVLAGALTLGGLVLGALALRRARRRRQVPAVCAECGRTAAACRCPAFDPTLKWCGHQPRQPGEARNACNLCEDARTGGERGAVRLNLLIWGTLGLGALGLIGTVGTVRLVDLQEEAEDGVRTGVAAGFVLSGLLLAAAALSPQRRRHRERGAVSFDPWSWVILAVAAAVAVAAVYCLSPAFAQPQGAPPTEDRSLPPPPPGTYSPLGVPWPLQQGLIALQAGWPRTAHLHCGRAAQALPGYRAQALLCQGRAALGLRWPREAERLARLVLAERLARLLAKRPAVDRQLLADVRVLLGDALRALGDCRGARTEYLLGLEAQPDHAGALAGLKACQADPPRPAGPTPGAQAVPHA